MITVVEGLFGHLRHLGDERRVFVSFRFIIARIDAVLLYRAHK